MVLSDKDQAKLDAQLKKMAKTYAKAADETVAWTIGELALSLLGEKASITRDDIRKALESRLETTPSARGKGAPDLDIERQRFLAALRRLDEIQAPSQASDPQG